MAEIERVQSVGRATFLNWGTQRVSESHAAGCGYNRKESPELSTETGQLQGQMRGLRTALSAVCATVTCGSSALPTPSVAAEVLPSEARCETEPVADPLSLRGADLAFILRAIGPNDERYSISVVMRPRRPACVAVCAEESDGVRTCGSSTDGSLPDSAAAGLVAVAQDLHALKISPTIDSPLVLDGFSYELAVHSVWNSATFKFTGAPTGNDPGSLEEWALNALTIAAMPVDL